MIHKPTVERLLKIAAVPISCNPVWFVSIYLLLLFCNFLFAWNGSRMIGALQLFLDLYMVVILLALLPGNASRLLRALLAVVLYAVCAVDLFCYSRLGCPLPARRNPAHRSRSCRTSRRRSTPAPRKPRLRSSCP